MRNPLPESVAKLCTHAGYMSAGLAEIGGELSISQITPVLMNAARDAVVSAQDAFNERKSLRGLAYDSFHVPDQAGQMISC